MNDSITKQFQEVETVTGRFWQDRPALVTGAMGLLDRISRFIRNHQGLHLGKAFCLAKMRRTREAELEFTLSKELVPRKAMQK